MDYLLSLLTFFFGLFWGNRLAIDRDKRKEFNQATSPIYYKLKEYLDHENLYYLPSTKELENISEYFGFWRRKGFVTQVKALKEEEAKRVSATTHDLFNGLDTVEPSYVSQHLPIVKRLIKFVERK